MARKCKSFIALIKGNKLPGRIGPQGFILYTSPVGDIIRCHNFHFHCYTDDIQLYGAFDHKIPGDCEQTKEHITQCISDINRWMLHNKLQLNQDKTELFVVANARVFNLVANIQLNIDGTIIKPSIC